MRLTGSQEFIRPTIPQSHLCPSWAGENPGQLLHQQWRSETHQVYEIPIAAVTNYHTCGLKQCNLLSTVLEIRNPLLPWWFSGKKKKICLPSRRFRFIPLSGISGTSPEEGNGNPLQYSCLGNPMDTEAWWDTTHGGHKRIRHDLAMKQPNPAKIKELAGLSSLSAVISLILFCLSLPLRKIFVIILGLPRSSRIISLQSQLISNLNSSAFLIPFC